MAGRDGSESHFESGWDVGKPTIWISPACHASPGRNREPRSDGLLPDAVCHKYRIETLRNSLRQHRLSRVRLRFRHSLAISSPFIVGDPYIWRLSPASRTTLEAAARQAWPAASPAWRPAWRSSWG